MRKKSSSDTHQRSKDWLISVLFAFSSIFEKQKQRSIVRYTSVQDYHFLKFFWVRVYAKQQRLRHVNDAGQADHSFSFLLPMWDNKRLSFYVGKRICGYINHYNQIV